MIGPCVSERARPADFMYRVLGTIPLVAVSMRHVWLQRDPAFWRCGSFIRQTDVSLKIVPEAGAHPGDPQASSATAVIPRRSA